MARSIGNVVAPARFIFFVAAFAAAVPLAYLINREWYESTMIGFDAAAILFLLACIPLLGTTDAKDIRAHAEANDANRAGLLGITALVMVVVLLVVAKEMGGGGGGSSGGGGAHAIETEAKVLIIATLAIAWLFSNTIYALHYAHLYYRSGAGKGAAGIDFPGSAHPNYWDFVYFAFTLGMTFQTSDVEISDAGIRRVVTFHCLAAFVFNLGVLAFTINVLGGGGA
jgi:uncharacterized membrane protein